MTENRLDYSITFRRGNFEQDITEQFRVIFDLADQSLDHGSGFWDDEDEKTFSELALLIGVPWDLMSSNTRKFLCGQQGHAKRDPGFSRVYVCGRCGAVVSNRALEKD